MIFASKERRYSIRKRVISSVRISHQLFGDVDGRSRDISDAGLYVVAKNLPNLPKGAHISLQMLDSSNPFILFNTRVVRMSDNGIGLAIVDYEVDGERFNLEELKRQWVVAYPNYYRNS